MAAFTIDEQEYPLLIGSDEIEYVDRTKVGRRWDGTASVVSMGGTDRIRYWPLLRVGLLEFQDAIDLEVYLASAEEVELGGDLWDEAVVVRPDNVSVVSSERPDLWLVEFDATEIGG